jgi:glucose dehydrogenase
MTTRIAHWSIIVLFSVIGLSLTLLGGFLVYLGGSLYYIAAGMATIATAFLMKRRSAAAPKLFAVIIGITLLWAVFESGLYLLALLPRIAAWLGLGLWFFTPLYRSTLQQVSTDILSAARR